MRQNMSTNSRSRASIIIIVGFAACLFAVSPLSASAQSLIAYYDFEGADTAPFPVNFGSHTPAIFNGSSTLVLTNLPTTITSQESGQPLNGVGGGAPNLTALGLNSSQTHSPAELDMPLTSLNGFHTMSVSFAISNNGNGYAFYQGFYSTNGGGAFTAIGVPQSILATLGTIKTFAVPAAANSAKNLVLRIEFSSGQSATSPLQTSIDNIQVNGTPAAPSAAGVSVSGRVLTPDGRGVRNARVVITDSLGVARAVTTSSFGSYVFDEVPAGASYVMTVQSKLYRFASRLVEVTDTLTNIDFVGQE